MHMAMVAAEEGIDEKQPARQCGVLKRWTSENENGSAAKHPNTKQC